MQYLASMNKIATLVLVGIAVFVLGLMAGTALERYLAEQHRLEEQRLLELSHAKKPVKKPVPPPEPPRIPEPPSNDLPFPVDPTNI